MSKYLHGGRVVSTRHHWRKGRGWMVCEQCGCRYQTGNVSRTYEQPSGERTESAGECQGFHGDGREAEKRTAKFLAELAS